MYYFLFSLPKQAYCTLNAGRTEPSLGRRRRDVSVANNKNQTAVKDPNNSGTEETTPGEEEKVRQVIEVSMPRLGGRESGLLHSNGLSNFPQVYESRYDMPLEQATSEPAPQSICLTSREYYSMVVSLFMFLVLLITVSMSAGIYYKYFIFIFIIIIFTFSKQILSTAYNRVRYKSVDTKFNIVYSILV